MFPGSTHSAIQKKAPRYIISMSTLSRSEYLQFPMSPAFITHDSQMPVFYLNALKRYRADSFTSISQIANYITSSFSTKIKSEVFTQRWDALAESHSKKLADIAKAAEPKSDGTFGTGYLCRAVRKLVPQDSIFAIEAVTNTLFVADNIQATLPGSWINCGGGGLGWSGGGALGIKLASEFENGAGKGKFVVCIVGDGTFLFSVPGSVYWISHRYKTPVLTIVLNNKGNLSYYWNFLHPGKN